jgi:hypothetical protein
MNQRQILVVSLLYCIAAGASAQQADPPSAKPTAQSEAGEPRANALAPSAQTEAGEPGVRTSPAPAKPAAGTPSKPAGGAKPAAPGAQKGPNTADRLELSTATVTGDREQPKVMYIVPWKRSDIGDLEGKPMNSLVDEILSPVDRDEFRRQVRYYQTVKSDAPPSGASPQPGQGEK